MRTRTSAERALIAGARVNHHLRVEVENVDRTWKDLTALGGVDWVDACEWGEDVDSTTGTFTLTLRRETSAPQNLSLAPLIGGSPLNRSNAGAYAPLLDAGRNVRITTAVTAAGVAPAAGDWKLMFVGPIDEVDWFSPQVSVTGRDLGGWLVDRFIEEERAYATTGPTPIETVMQQLLNDWPAFGGAPTLYVPTSPAWMLNNPPDADGNSTKQARKGLLDALQNDDALSIGWLCRYRFDAADTFRLTFYQPDRAGLTPVDTFGPAEYRDITALKVSAADVRNRFHGVFYDSAKTKHERWTEDLTSQGKYGVKFMEIALAPGDNIDTDGEMDTLLAAAKSDLSTPPASHEVETLYYWPAQLHDVYTYLANGDHYDSDQTLAVVGYRHKFANGEGVTTITCAGHVIGAYRAWQRKAAPDEGLTTGDESPDSSLTDFRWTDAADGLTRTYTWTRGADVGSVWVHDRLRQAPVIGNPWPTSSDTPDAFLAAGTDSYTTTLPPTGYQKFLQFEPRLADFSVHEIRRATIEGIVVPPTVLPRAVPNANRDAVDAYALVSSPAAEPMRLLVKLSEAPGAATYGLVTSNLDTTPLFVAHGTEVQPTAWFSDGTNPPAQILAGLALGRDQLGKVFFQAVGQHSGISSAWVALPLTLMEKPWLESIALTFDKATGQLRLRGTGGAHCASALFEVSPSATFASGVLSAALALADGQDVTQTWPVTGASLGITWYGRITPSNGPLVSGAPSGLAGVAQVDEVAVPAPYDLSTSVSETQTTGTFTVVLTDPSHAIDLTNRLQAYIRAGAGSRVLTAPTTAPAAGGTAGTYTWTFNLDALHTTVVELVVNLADGTSRTLPGVTFDSNKVPDILTAGVHYVGAIATVTATLDTDAAAGASNFEYSLNGGSSWTALTIPANLVVQFTVAMSSIVAQQAKLRAKNSAGNYGPSVDVGISRYDAPPGAGPSITATLTPGGSTYVLSYTYAATSINYYVDGVLTALPASPVVISRPSAGNPSRVLALVATQNGETITWSESVAAIDADTVAPDVQLIEVSRSTTQIVFTGIATNPKTSAGLNATYYFDGCSGTVAGNSVGAGGSFTAASGSPGVTIVANRPALGAAPGSVRMTAGVGGGGNGFIARTISEQTKDFTPPVFEPYLTTGSTSYTGNWSAPSAGIWIYGKTDNGAWVLQYDGASVFNTAYVVSRNASGGSAKTMYLKAVNQTTGAEAQKSWPVPPQDAAGGGSSAAFTSFPTPTPVYSSTGFISVSWASSYPAGTVFRVFATSPNRGGIFTDEGTTTGTSLSFQTDEDLNASGASSIQYTVYVQAEDASGISQLGRTANKVSSIAHY